MYPPLLPLLSRSPQDIENRTRKIERPRKTFHLEWRDPNVCSGVFWTDPFPPHTLYP